jgi:4-hydroxy-tetrahydrodipicolinate synthase
MYSGIWLPIVTPFQNGKVDVDALQRLASQYLGSGISGIVALGTTGEAALLSGAERITVLQALSEVVDGHLPMLIGLGGSDTRAVLAQMRQYESWDCAGYLVSAPSYVCPGQDGIQWHFEQVARSTQYPVVLYNVPHRTGVNIAASTVERLLEQDNIVAIKECAAQNFSRLRGLPISVLCGADESFLDCLDAGGKGGILASAHVCADVLADVHALARAGKQADALRAFAAILPLVRLLFAAPNPAAIKAALCIELGISDETRMPIGRAPQPLVERLRGALEQLRRRRPELAASR